MAQAEFRFYAELNFFLPPSKKQVSFTHVFERKFPLPKNQNCLTGRLWAIFQSPYMGTIDETLMWRGFQSISCLLQK